MPTRDLQVPLYDLSARRGAREIAYSHLRRLIVSGELQPGVRVAEKELATRVGMSRTPLRESIKALETQGFMTRLPNGRIMVSPLSPRGLKDLFATRLAIERLIVESVVDESSETHMDETLRPAADAIRAAMGLPLPEARVFGERFHFALAEICPNRVASTLLSELRDRIALYRKIGPDRSPERRLQAAKEHLLIYDLVRARQAVEAVAIMEEHIRRGQVVALQFLEGAQASAGIVDSRD